MEQKPPRQPATPSQPSTTPSAAPAQPQPAHATPTPPAQKSPVKSSKKMLITIGLVVAAVLIAVVASIVILPGILARLNPSQQLATANNTQRQTDVSAILAAVELYTGAHQGQLPPGTPSQADAPLEISSSGTGEAFCTALVPQYIAQMPSDPSESGFTSCVSYNTGYTITIDKNGKLTINAPKAELNATIEEIQ